MIKTEVATKQVSGADALIDSLIRHGVSHIFGYPGGANLPIYDAIYNAEQKGQLKHYLVRHEQGAAHAADGYARSTGKVGVCLATSGPGATNLVTGLATAMMDSIPMVALTGQVPKKLLGTDGFQEIDIFGITLPIVKHSYQVRQAADIPRIIAEAFYIAKTGRPGPVLIDIPKDVGIETFNYQPVEPDSVNLPGYDLSVTIDSNAFDNALHLLKNSTKPLLYVGGGAIASNAQEEIKELAEKFQIPVTTTLMGKGSFDENHPLSLGMLGMHGTAYSNFAVSECDLLIAVGARFDDRVASQGPLFAENAKVIHIDIDPAEMNKTRIVDVALAGDVKTVLRSFLNKIEEQGGVNASNGSWLAHLQELKADYPLDEPHPSEILSPQEVIREVYNQCPDAYFTTDVGQHQMWAAQFINNKPRRWMSSGGLGTMGYGVPAAVGVQAAFPNEQVICISGDGSFQMNMQELGTIANYDLKVKIVILNNGWLGMVRQWQHLFYQDHFEATNLEKGSPKFAKLGEVYDIKGILVENREDLKAAVAEMLSHDGAVILEVKVKKDEDCYPMIAPGQANTNMLGLHHQ